MNRSLHQSSAHVCCIYNPMSSFVKMEIKTERKDLQIMQTRILLKIDQRQNIKC